ncbi:hypothetical protein LCGC14_2564950 [marine sediment metagenome]|uniref:Uncharacterized protein n=1 Tax=marine sediment metagenome TaxID=412755 RepID=A0A0F9B6U5_9ZZZZ
MPRTEPAEDATFPVYRVQAVCSNPDCGKKGWTKALQNYPKDTVITTPCSSCVKSWETRVERFHGQQPLGVIRSKGARDPEPERTPREHKPHWTDDQ